MSKFEPRISYLGALRENLCEPLYMYLGHLIINCDKEKDFFEKYSIVLDKLNNKDDVAIDYLIKLTLFYIKCRMNNSNDVNIIRQLENIFNHYTFSSVSEFSIKNEVDSLVNLASELEPDVFNDKLRDILSRVFKHFGCSLDENKDFKGLYDEIGMDGVRILISDSEKNGFFGENKIYFFDNQFLIDIDIALGAPSLNSYDQLKNDIVKNILMHIGYLYLLNPKEMKNENEYLQLGELLENIDDVVKIYLIRLVNFYITCKVTARDTESAYLVNNIQFIEKILERYGFVIKTVEGDIEQVCGEFVKPNNYQMLDIHCQRVLEKVFSYFDFDDEVPKIVDIANLYRDLGFVFENVADLYNEAGVSNVDMLNKIPYISSEKYDVKIGRYRDIPSFLSMQRITYLDLAKNRGLTDEQIEEKANQLEAMLRYYEAGVNSAFANLFNGIWHSGQGVWGEKHGINILNFVNNQFFQFRSFNTRDNRLSKHKENGT